MSLLPRLLPTRPIRLFVADLDGCVTAGGQWNFDPALFSKLQDYARRAETDPRVPRITFNTGRPQPYVECMARAAGITVSPLCEFGLLLWELPSREVHWHPQWNDDFRKDREALEAVLAKRIAAGAPYRIEPGKMAQLTLIPAKRHHAHELLPEAEAIAREAGGAFTLDVTNAVLSFLPASLGKEAGVRWLAAHSGVALEEMASIGDSESDAEFLRATAISFAPQNGVRHVKEVATHVSDHGPGDAVLEAMEALIEANYRLG